MSVNRIEQKYNRKEPFMEERKNHGTETAAVRKLFESKAGLEAVERAGNNPNLKGIVHECLYKNTQNLKPENVLNGTKAVLSKSPTAIRDDVLFMKGGHVVGRAQLKDTVNSVSKTVKQAANGKYAGTNLLGTAETAEAFKKATENMAKKGTTVTQKMGSTGISSTDTSRIATEFLGGKVTSESLKKVAGSSGVTGGVISGGLEAISAGKELMDGDIDGGEFLGRVTKETVGGGLSAAGGSVAATAASAGVATALAATTAPAWIPAAVGLGAAVAVGTVIKGAFDFLFD